MKNYEKQLLFSQNMKDQKILRLKRYGTKDTKHCYLEYELTKLLISNVGSSYSLDKLVPHKTIVKRKGKIHYKDIH